MQIEKILKFDNVNLFTLLGVNDINLRQIERKFDSTISVRGESVYLKGESKEVDLLENILKEMVYVVNTTGKLTSADIDTILNLSLNSNSSSFHSYDDIILYTKKDVIKAKNPTQVEYYKAVLENDICFAIGPAGTGKTYLAVAFAISALKKGIVQRIVLARPAVEAGESLGFLPGDLKEKIDPYLRPLYDALQDMLPAEQLANYTEKGIIEIVPLAYMRGRTLNNAYVILDEAQNATSIQMKMFLTRLGPNSKAIITGDITQIDLPSSVVSGLVQVIEILSNVDGVGFIYFNKSDVVRHKLVKDIIEAYDKYKNGN